jgi:hypothetical protein
MVAPVAMMIEMLMMQANTAPVTASSRALR